MVGQHIGHYRVVHKIGEGGMGHVYLAEDVRLDRKVALKVLAQPSPNPDQVARFEREAKAAAALDHPNILAIHEFGHDGSIPYVVMELLEGRNLRQRLQDGPLPVRTAIDYALDIARGLLAAHEKGIWHRDLKPENIFITRDGRVKILDFGLANIRGSSDALSASADPGATREPLTRPGLVLGTVGYMAPEQVRGEPVDGRADIFAFGAVLFEMLTARRAFDEPTAVETLHSILKTAPPLRLLNEAGVPAAVVQIVGRCLDKERNERYRSAGEVASALQTTQSAIGLDPPASGSLAQKRLDSWKEIAAYLRRGVRTVQRWEREEQLPVHRLEHAKRGSVYADRNELDRWWESRRRALAETPPAPEVRRETPTPSVRSAGATPLPRVERVTNTSSLILSPALSSDARMLLYISNGGQEAAAPQVWLQQIGGAAMRLTSGLRDCADPTFSADDTKVLFTAKGDASLNIYAVPTFGGEPRLLKRNARSARMSPDGKWLSYVSLESPRGVRIETRDGEDQQTLAPDLRVVSFAVWSPDSTSLLVHAHPDPRFEPDYWIVPIDGRPPFNTGIVEKFRSQASVLDFPPVWVAGSIIFVRAGREGVMLWRQRLAPDTLRIVGEAEPLTRGTEWAAFPAAAAGRLAFVNASPDINLWSLGLDESTGATHGAPRRMTRGPGVLGHLCLAANGRMLTYFCTRTGMPALFLKDLENGSETSVEAGPASLPKGFPAISPTGARLAYSTLVPGPRAMRPILILDVASGTSRQLCEDCGGRPRLWLDEESILIETFGSRLNAFLVVDATTGHQRPVLASDERSLANARVSPDGGCIAFDAAFPGGSPTVFIAALNRTAPVSESDWTALEDNASHPFWSRDGRLLYYLPTTPNKDLRSAVRARRIGATSRRPEGDSFVAATLTETMIPSFLAGTAPIVARDQMVCVLTDLRGDIWMLDV